MGTGFAVGAVEMVRRAILSLDMGMCVVMRTAIYGMRALGTAMGVAPERIERDLSTLELVGNLCIFYLMLNSCAAIFCAMGRLLQCQYGRAMGQQSK